MERRRNRKVIFQYIMGVFLLSASVLLALFVPGWYSDWQDRLLLEKMVLSSREDIEFLDVASLDMEGRMKLLKESVVVEWSGEMESEYDAAYEVAVFDRLEVFRGILEQWTDAGLLPEIFDTTAPFDEFFSQNYIVDYEVTSVVLGPQTTLPVCVFALRNDEKEVGMLVIMDAEKDIVYYVALVGYVVQEYMAGLLGYESLEHMVWLVLEGKELGQQEDYSGYDFAKICKARSDVITGTPEELNFDVNLEFDSFTGYAQRRVLGVAGVPDEYGISIALGTDKWNSFISEALADKDMSEWNEWTISTAVWQQRITMDLYGMEKMPESFDEDSFAGFYDENGQVIVQEEATAAEVW